MTLPKNDVFLPVLFVGVIFPMLAGGWWRYFSGHANQTMNPVHVQSAPANMGNAVQARPLTDLTRRHSKAKTSDQPVQTPSIEESWLTDLFINDDSDN